MREADEQDRTGRTGAGVSPTGRAAWTIEPWSNGPRDISAGDLGAEDVSAMDEVALDAIFFEASGTRTFASDAARAAFRERWLGRYLSAPDGIALVAREGGAGGPIVGYVVGTTGDPARDRRFDDITYFQDLAPETALYPAHLHVNCAATWRGRGVGADLVAAFVAEAARRGARGVHIVTGAGMRNVGFYTRNGFFEVGRALSGGKPVVMLARALP